MIAACPVCYYSLEGLPDTHNCPECGFAYQRDATLIEQARLVWKVIGVISAVTFALALLGWRLGYMLLPSLLISGSLLGASLWRLRSKRRVFLVSNDDLRVLVGGELDSCYPLADIESARLDRVTGCVILTRVDGTLALRIPQSDLWSWQRARRLTAAINQRRESRCSTAGQEEMSG